MMHPIPKIAHIGIAVRSIDKALPFYVEALGLHLEKITEVETEGVKVAFLRIGDTRFELLEPILESSAIAAFIQKKGEGVHHIALEVDDIDMRLAHLKNQSVRLIDQQARTGAEEAQVAFIHPKAGHGVLYELCQP